MLGMVEATQARPAWLMWNWQVVVPVESLGALSPEVYHDFCVEVSDTYLDIAMQLLALSQSGVVWNCLH